MYVPSYFQNQSQFAQELINLKANKIETQVVFGNGNVVNYWYDNETQNLL